MKPSKFHFLLLFILLLLPVHFVMAHAPDQPTDNESLATAYTISDPAKSWAIYAELHEEEAQYYKLDLLQNERLLVMLFVPTFEESSFLPNLAVMGPGITSQDALPEYVETVDRAGIMSWEAQRPPRPTYEPFTPSSYYYLANVDQTVSVAGTYHLAVYEPSQGGRYGLVIGYREEYGLDEWVLIPIDAIGVHQWEGQSLSFIVAPMLVTLTIGFAFILLILPAIFRKLFSGIGFTAGLLYLGSGFMTSTQMILALIVSTPDIPVIFTLIFVLTPFLLAIAIFRLTSVRKDVTNRAKVYLAILGVLGLLTWTGLIIGPALALLASLVPVSKRKNNRLRSPQKGLKSP